MKLYSVKEASFQLQANFSSKEVLLRYSLQYFYEVNAKLEGSDSFPLPVHLSLKQFR
jgi:hypothetical protein